MDEAKIDFLKSILETNMELNDVAHESADFLSGLSGIILAISLTQIFSATGYAKYGFSIISLTCFIVVFFSIGVIRPKIGQSKINLMYYRGLLRFPRAEYLKYLKNTLKSEEKVVKEFSDEIYDLSLELRHKYSMIRKGADILAVGLLVGMALIFIG